MMPTSCNCAADLGGLKSWLNAGLDRVTLANGFLGSDEFARKGALDDHSFVALVTQQAYGAAASAAHQQQWEQYLATHSRAELVAQIVGDAGVASAQYGLDGLWLL